MKSKCLGPYWTVTLLALGATQLAAQVAGSSPSAAEAFAAIQTDYRRAYEASRSAKTASERDRAAPRAEVYATRIRELVRDWPDDPVAVGATVWLLERELGDARLEGELLDAIRTRHLANPRLADLCKVVEDASTSESAAFLRSVLAGSPHREVRGRACYALGRVLAREAGWVQRLRSQDDPEFVAAFAAERGTDGMAATLRQDPAMLTREAETRFAAVIERFADLKAHRGLLGERAAADLFELRHLGIGSEAPEIEGADLDGVAMRLSAFRGRVVFLCFWGFW